VRPLEALLACGALPSPDHENLGHAARALLWADAPDLRWNDRAPPDDDVWGKLEAKERIRKSTDYSGSERHPLRVSCSAS
jgi:hypothetical protein